MKFNPVSDKDIDSKETAISTGADPAEKYPHIMKLPTELFNWLERNSMQIIVAWDQSENLIFSTESIEKHLGYKVADILGTKWKQYLQKSDLQYVHKEVFSMGEGEGYSTTLKIPDKNGQYKWFSWTASMQISDGEPFFIAILQHLENKTDIDDLLIRSEKLSVAGQLAASIVHEIRNPLTSLKGFIQLMEAGMEAKAEYYRIMNEEIEKMEAMTTELLYISRPPVNEKAWESAQSMVKDVVVLLEPQAKQKNIDLSWETEKDLEIFCNRSQIKQALLNLIKNAIEAIDVDGGIVQVKMKALTKSLIIDVVDNGPGIPEELIQKLGEPFLTTKENGTGLGLMVTKQLLQQHGAKLEIFQNEEQGSTFRVYLPAVPKQQSIVNPTE